MKKKLLVVLATGLFLVGISGMTSATPVNIAYTGDNIINAWYIVDGSTTTTLSLGANTGDWENADTYTATLDGGTSYEVICEVDDYVDGWDVAGFLAEIT